MTADVSLQTDAALMSLQNRKSILPKAPAGASNEQLRKVSQDFEAIFVSQMLQPMFAELGAETPFGGGSSEAMWQSMQVEEYGKAIVKSGGIGVADSVYREMLKLQEVQ